MENTIWELSPDPICILSRTFKIRSANAAFCQWVGRAHAELEGRSLNDFLSVRDNIYTLKSDPNSKAIVVKKVFLNDTDSVLYFSLSLANNYFDKEFQNLALVARYTTNAVIITNPQGYTEWINQGCQLMTGYSLSDFLGKKPGQLLQGPLTDPQTIATIRKNLKTQSDFRVQILNYNRFGDTYWIEMNISPIFSNSGELIRYISVQNEITKYVNKEIEFERLATVAEKTTNSVIITDKLGRVEWINQGCKDLTGYSIEDFLGKTPGQVLQGPDTDTLTRQKIALNLKAKVSFTEKILNYRPDGEPYWIELSISPIFDKAGELKGFIGIQRNIDEIIKQNLKLEDLSYVARFVTNSVIIADKRGYVEWINEACVSISGYTLSDFKGKKPGQLLQGPLTNPETRKRISEGLNRRETVKEEILNYSKNGRPYWIELIINPVFDRDGKFIKFVSVQIDIDERVKRQISLRQANEEIAQNNEELQQMTEELSSAFESMTSAKEQVEEFLAYQEAIFNSVDASIVAFSTSGEILRVNQATERWMDFKLSELVGLRTLDLPYLLKEEVQAFHDELSKKFGHEVEKYEDILTKVQYAESVSGRIWNFLRRDGSTFPVRASFNPIYNSKGKSMGFLMVAYDISKTKALEEEIAKQTKRLTDSIKYAKRIQLGVIPRASHYQGLATEHFVINLPKNVVSGDFYWAKKISDSQFLAVCVDCTGHGVPGAMMSMLAVALLNSIVSIQNIQRPSDILHQLDNLVRNTLGQNEDSEISDGMDVAICLIDKEKLTLEFSGALRPIVVADQSGVRMVEYSKNWIGGNYDKVKKTFETQTVSLQKGTMIYLFSDGLQSQFGGQNDRKFGLVKLKNLLEHIYHLPANEQKERIVMEWQQWRGEKPQTDDILFVGLRI
jgi:PAS domain S-box-containing protein